jgi:hypothetical protein
MYQTTDKDGLIYILSSERFFEFDYLQKLAEKNNQKKVLSNGKRDEYFFSVLKDETPAFSAVCSNKGLYPANALRATKFFINPTYKNSSLPLVKKAYLGILEIFQKIEGYNFFFISRHPSEVPFTKIYESIGWEVYNEKLYLISEDPDSAYSWKHIYYKGDIQTFTVPSMTIDEYKIKFKEEI